jgi:hypothetical protein
LRVAVRAGARRWKVVVRTGEGGRGWLLVGGRGWRMAVRTETFNRRKTLGDGC